MADDDRDNPRRARPANYPRELGAPLDVPLERHPRARSHANPHGVPTLVARERSVPVLAKPGTIPPPPGSGVHVFYDEAEYERARQALFRETVRTEVAQELDKLLVPWREMEQRKADDRLKLNEDVATLGKSVDHLTNHVAGLRASVTDLQTARAADGAERASHEMTKRERRWDFTKMILGPLISTVILGLIALLVAGLKGAL